MPCLPRTCCPIVAEAPGLVELGAQRLRSLSMGRSDIWGTGSQPRSRKGLSWKADKLREETHGTGPNERTIRCDAEYRPWIRSVTPTNDAAESFTRFAPTTLQSHTHVQQVA
jgi:hypothetical protein